MNVFIILDAIRVVKYMCKQRLFSVGGNLKKCFCLHFNTLLKCHTEFALHIHRFCICKLKIFRKKKFQKFPKSKI